MIHIGALIYSNWKNHSLIFQGRNNIKSTEKQIVKEKKPKSDIEDESSKPTDEGSMKKVKKKGSTYQCYYWMKGFHPNNKCFNNNMYIMYQLLEKHNNEVLDELEKLVESLKNCHSAQFQGDINYALSVIVK